MMYKKVLFFLLVCLLQLERNALFAQCSPITLYPEPQQVQVTGQRLEFASLAPISDNTGYADEYILQLLRGGDSPVVFGKTLPFTVDRPECGDSMVQRSSAYRLSVSPKGINVMAFDRRSLFYAVQTLLLPERLRTSSLIVLLNTSGNAYSISIPGKKKSTVLLRGSENFVVISNVKKRVLTELPITAEGQHAVQIVEVLKSD